jgi:hypothetical protein
VRRSGAADGPGVRRVHGASTAAWPARFEASWRSASVRRHGPRAAHGLGLGVVEKVRGATSRRAGARPEQCC